VREAEQTLNHVVEGVHEVVGLIGTIASASVEQNQGMQQISVALDRLKDIAQQNAALVEQGLAASMSFEQEGVGLAESVRLFRLEEEKIAKATRAAA
jgi:methyl-accepting chemotaxis protein